jgi:hypothetical protein
LESLTERTVAVLSFHPTTTTLVSPATCADEYVTATLVDGVEGTAYAL